jgi:predicted acyltransferase (DUF342 family)
MIYKKSWKYILIRTTEYLSLFRLKALKDFGDVSKGDIGGLVMSYHNLSHKGNCWVYDKAKVYGDAHVSENARISGNAEVYGNSKVYGESKISGRANIKDNAEVSGYADIKDNARVFGNAEISGNTHAYGNARVKNISTLIGNAQVSELVDENESSEKSQNEFFIKLKKWFIKNLGNIS